MTDLTLDEFKGVSEEELAQILKEEARKICGPDSLKNKVRETVNDLNSLIHPKHKKRIK